MPVEHHQVVIVGAGPVGLIIALRLGQAGVKTLLLERHANFLPTTRATVFQPVVIEAFRELNILETIKQHAYLNREGITWRTPEGEKLGHLPLPKHDDSLIDGEQHDYVFLLGQNKMTALIAEEIKKFPSVEMRFQTSYVGLQQDDQKATLLLNDRKTEDDYYVTSDYVVGCDGANSSVRRNLCIPFEGFTFTDFTMMGADVWHNFQDDGYSLMNFVVDPEKWGVVIFTGQDKEGNNVLCQDGPQPLWRLAYAEEPGLPTHPEECAKRCQEWIHQFAPSTEGREVEVSRAEPYVLHQRLAKSGKQGRVMLAGDALHSNNPIGGLGLTTGILDGVSYGNCLARVCARGEDPSLLDTCARTRRDVWAKITGPISLSNITRLRSADAADVKSREEFFERLNADPQGNALEFWAKLDEMGAETFSFEL